MAPLKLGIIGCGKQAEKHVSGYQACVDVEITVADLIPDRAHALAELAGVACVDDPGMLLTGNSVAAVSICTPTPVHAPQILTAIETGKHFFCEKPLCQTASETARLLEAMRASRVVGQVGYIYRHVPVFREIKSLLGDPGAADGPVLGRLVSATMRMGGRGSAAIWKHRRESGGGAIPEMLVHMVDLAIWFFGPMAEVELLASRLLRPRRAIQGEMIDCDADDFVVARLRSASGVEIVVQADLVTPAFSQLVEIQGENGTAVGSIDAAMPSYVFCLKAVDGFQGGRKTPLPNTRRNLYVDQMNDFVGRIRQGVGADETVRDSVEVAKCLEALGMAARRD